MNDESQVTRRHVRVGGLSRLDLQAALAEAGVRLNESAETLLRDPVFESGVAQTEATIEVVECPVSSLGHTQGATLSEVLATARERGLLPCAPFVGPYLRLVTLDQASAPDSVMSNGRPPRGAVHIASERLRPDDHYPRGFYLRAVDGVPWLRGFRCSEDAPFSADDRFAFTADRSRSSWLSDHDAYVVSIYS